MNKAISIILGIILILAPILIVLNVPIFYNWGTATVEFLKGGVVILIVLIGIALIVLGITE